MGAALAIAITAWTLALSPAAVFAATSGPNDAGTGAASGTGTAWTGPGNITSPGIPYASATIAAQGNTNVLFGTNYGFSIPTSCVVDGIQVTINRSGTDLLGLLPFCQDAVVRLTKSGSTLVGSNHADTGSNWPLLFATKSYGGAADLWGTTWTPSEINASSFGVGLQTSNDDFLLAALASVDYIQVTVTYHDETAPATATVTVPQNGSWYTTTTVEPTFSGEAADNPGGRGLGANSTTFTLRNPSNQYWNGLAWQGGLFNLATTHSATTSGTVVTWDDAVPLPDWTIESTGTYTLQATAHDLDSNDTTGAATTFFISRAFDITASPSVNGTITPPGVTSVFEFQDATYTVTPDPGFAVDTVTVDGNPVSLIDGKYYLFSSVTASHTIAATFGAGWDITATPSTNGTITPSGVTAVLNGRDATYTVTPNAGFHIVSVTVDGNPVVLNAENQYVFDNVTADHTIAATFAANVYIQVWRFRSNSMIGSYLWTRDAAERDSIVANLPTIWTFEGRAFLINASNPANHDVMYRFRNKRDWTYFYTADPLEKANLENFLSETWQLEGPTWSVARTTPTPKPVWRFRCLHNSTHLWTSDPAEKDTIVNTLQADYELEGIAYWLGE